ncbi:MAG: peptidase A2A retrovirus catalytic [Crocosphaera sp.]
MFEGKYTELPNSSPIPLIQLQIRQSESIPSIKSQGILDTGADCTLVPFSIISQLQAVKLIRGRNTSVIYGVGKQKIIVVPYRVEIGFDGHEFIRIKAYACPDTDTDGLTILGRNFLNRYCITFNGRAKKFLIQ